MRAEAMPVAVFWLGYGTKSVDAASSPRYVFMGTDRGHLFLLTQNRNRTIFLRCDPHFIELFAIQGMMRHYI